MTVVRNESRGARLTLKLREDDWHSPAAERDLEGEPFAYFSGLISEIEKLNALDQDARHVNEQLLIAIGTRLARDLLSEPIRDRLAMRAADSRTRSLLIISEDPWIPWEVLFLGEAGGDGHFLGEAFALTVWMWDIPGCASLPLTKIGTVFPSDSGLASAGQEYEDLQLLARPSARQVEPIPARLLPLLEALRSRNFAGLHFSGHGATWGNNPDLWSLPLENFEALRAIDLATCALSATRPFVFLNACRSARSGLALTGLGGLARAFLQAGAGAVVGTHWEVHDRSARAFSRAFYQALFDESPLGQAALLARREIRREFPGNPAWLAYTVFGHPAATTSGLALHLPPLLRPSQTPLHRKIIDSSVIVRQKREGFVGREWVFAELDRFLAERPRGFFVLTGDPGIGKSALMAELVKTRGWVHHFTIRGEASSRPETFLASLCAQLIRRYELPYTDLPEHATRDGEALKSLLQEVAERLGPQEKEVVLVDALDEADHAPGATSNVLFLPSRLPDGVYFVLTRRREEIALRLDDPEQEVLPLDQRDERNLGDVRLFLHARLTPKLRAYIERQGIDEDEFLREMTARSQGNFMYLYHVLREIERGTYRRLDIAQLPVGLSNYYEDHWKRMQALRESDQYIHPVLETLAVAAEPVSVDLLGYLTEIRNLRQVRSVLRRWEPFLYSTGGSTGEARRYRLYHRSFGEFLEKKLDLQYTHARISDLLWKELFGELTV